MGGNPFKIGFLPFEKGSTLKGKNLLPLGRKFFSFRVDSFSERRDVQESKEGVPWLSPLSKMAGDLPCVLSPLKTGRSTSVIIKMYEL